MPQNCIHLDEDDIRTLSYFGHILYPRDPHLIPTMITDTCHQCRCVNVFPCVLCKWDTGSKARKAFKKRFKNVKEE